MTHSQDATGGTIGRAGEIINRFGGIRPMSAKTGIPVTTIQGWKQRDAIPANRRNELIDAANQHGINLSDMLMDIVGDTSPERPIQNESAKNPAQNPAQNKSVQEEEIVIPVQRMARSADAQDRADDRDLRRGSNQTTWIAAGGLILAAGVVGVILAMAPKVDSVSAQQIKIRELEQKMAEMEAAQKTQKANPPEESSLLPSDMSAKLSAIESKVGELSNQAKSYATLAADLKNGSMTARLSQVESHVNALLQQANAQGLQSMLQKVDMLQQSARGNTELRSVLSSLVTAAQGASPDDLAATFSNLRDSDPRVAETFKDVAPEDMKAAVMLLGMSQLRDSLARDNTSFEQDLQLLKTTMAKDNPELLAAIDRLAPKAKSGVLTPTGLSKELRGLTGDIVSASLSGQDVSISDKAVARLGTMITVEKNGQQISGTHTQIVIAQAQKKLDAGDVAGAVALLQQIQGPAAAKTQPLIDQAQATMLASQVQHLLGQNLVQTLKNMTHKSAPYTVGNGGANQIIDTLKSVGQSVGQSVGTPAIGGQ